MVETFSRFFTNYFTSYNYNNKELILALNISIEQYNFIKNTCSITKGVAEQGEQGVGVGHEYIYLSGFIQYNPV